MHKIGLCNHQWNTFFYDWQWQLPRHLEICSLPGLSSINGWGNFSSPRQHYVYWSTRSATIIIINHNSIIYLVELNLWKLQGNIQPLNQYGTLEVDAVECYCGCAYNGIEKIMPSPVKLMDIILVDISIAAANSCCWHSLRLYTSFTIVLMTCTILNCCSPFMRSSYHASTNQHVAAPTIAIIFTLATALFCTESPSESGDVHCIRLCSTYALLFADTGWNICYFHF